ncbi:hypothetical protein K0H71_15045 [Bacillus sp. IITD106]|nr:hypothetical protein [Bacillus sp. IITD106]
MIARNKYASTYICCENYDFLWSEEEVFDFECQWNEGKTLEEMAEYFNRPQIEVLFLALDRAELGKINPRKGWIQ